MSDRWLVLGSVATIVVAFGVAIAQAGSPTEHFVLAPNLPRVTAAATLEGDVLTMSVSGAPPGERVEGEVDRLACAPGGRALGAAVADRDGHARWTVRGALSSRVRDGRHVLTLTVGGAAVACGSISASRPVAKPARQRHWGIWSFARHFID